MSKFYITTPIYYVNAKPHLGSAYTTIAADILARYHRLRDEEVFFLTGTDEHGVKIAEAAKEQGKSPKEWCDENAARYQLVWDQLQISYNHFIRTTDPYHEEAVAKIVQTLYDKNLIYKGVYSGLYCVGCERYYTQKELVDGKCPDHQKEPISLSEDCYFFKLSAFQEPLLELIGFGDWVIEPTERRNEVLGFLKSEKLEDLAISRSKVEWGVPLSWDDSQTIYVWIDALLNYLTGLGWDGQNNSKFKTKVPEHTAPVCSVLGRAQKICALVQNSKLRYWPPDVQLIGKDILRFHAVIWPALLLALEIPLPKKLFVHGFFTVNSQKMSKSLGNVIDPEEMINIFGSDATRYLLISAFPFGQDGDISMAKFYDRYNADLANGIGNLVARVLALATKMQNEKCKMQNDKSKFKNEIEKVWQKYEKALEKLAFEEATKTVLDFVAFCDRYVNETKPWKLAKDDLAKFQEVIYNLLEGLRQLAWLIMPFMPNMSDKIFEQLGILSGEKKKSLKEAKEWGSVEFKKIERSQILFPRI